MKRCCVCRLVHPEHCFVKLRPPVCARCMETLEIKHGIVPFFAANTDEQPELDNAA